MDDEQHAGGDWDSARRRVASGRKRCYVDATCSIFRMSRYTVGDAIIRSAGTATIEAAAVRKFNLLVSGFVLGLLVWPASNCWALPSASSSPTLLPIAKFVPEFAAEFDGVGQRIAIDGAAAVGSAGFARENGVVTGAAFRFDAVANQAGDHVSPGPLPEWSDFGVSLALQGDRLLVGADDEPAPRSGSAYLFDASSNLLIAKLEADDGVVGSDFWFGYASALTAEYAIVGAPAFRTPSAYVFDATTGAQVRKLTPAGGPRPGFGSALAATESLAIVGSPREGVAYLFDLQSGVELGALTGADTTAADQFGISIAVDGNLAVIGAYHADGVGAAYVFDLSSGQQLAKLSAPRSGQTFGRAVAVDGVRVLVGAPPRSPGAGSAYLFDATSGELLAELADGAAGSDSFGVSVALDGYRLFVGDPMGLDAQGLRTGAIYAFAIPEPTALALAAISMFALRRRRAA